jgi:ABC-type oligopeptide transport system substrate-binding subunit
MRARTPAKLAAVAAVTALLATGCGDVGGDDASGESGGTLRAYLSEPSALIPSAANDSESNQVITEVYRGLIDYTPDGEVINAMAESIESEDNTTWTIKVAQGHTFTNGEPVDADAFIRAWNFAAYGPNANEGAYFYYRIAGFSEMQADPPEAEELAGLTKVDDYTFTVELNAPFAGFPATVGYMAYFPLAQECLDDVETCNEMPIGNGPYQLESPWEHDVQVVLVRNEDFKLADAGNADRIVFRIYESEDAAYAAFRGGELDIIDQVPSARVAEAQAQYPDGYFEVPNNSLTYLGIPWYDDRFTDLRVRQAFSMAIDRQAIIDAVFDGRRRPATGWVSPLFDGYREGVCQFCGYDPEQAADLLADAGGFEGTLDLYANAGAGHELWMQALGDQLKENLGIEYTLDASLQFAEYLEFLEAQESTGPFRLGWGPDYPVIETYLTALYGTDSSSNYSYYSNPELDQLIAQGDAAADLAEAITIYQQAEDVVAADMVTIPLWWETQTVLYNTDTVDQLVFNNIDYEDYGETTLHTSG